jgi:hypothetical protein
MALPSDANVDLLVCDAVRQNPDGKLDLAGFFPAPTIRLDPAAKLPAALNLTFVFVLKDGDGQFPAIFRILDPLGKELHRQALPDVRKAADTHHVMMMAVRLIPIALSGDYPVVLELDGREYRRPVHIFQ